MNPDNLMPICTNSKLALDFIQAANSTPIANERVATVALTKTGNLPINASIGLLLAEFARFMASNNSNVPFIVPAFRSPSSIRRMRSMSFYPTSYAGRQENLLFPNNF